MKFEMSLRPRRLRGERTKRVRQAALTGLWACFHSTFGKVVGPAWYRQQRSQQHLFGTTYCWTTTPVVGYSEFCFGGFFGAVEGGTRATTKFRREETKRAWLCERSSERERPACFGNRAEKCLHARRRSIINPDDSTKNVGRQRLFFADHVGSTTYVCPSCLLSTLFAVVGIYVSTCES